MKTICSVLLFLCSLTVCFSQNVTSFIGQDTTKAYKEPGYPAIFIDSVFFSDKCLVGINPRTISKIDIKKDSITIDGKPYGGSIYITLKEGRGEYYTLDELKKRFVKENLSQPILYMINNEFIKEEVQSYKIQKDYILKVNCIQSKEFEGFADTNFTIVQILTKTNENLSEAKKVRIR